MKIRKGSLEHGILRALRRRRSYGGAVSQAEQTALVTLVAAGLVVQDENWASIYRLTRDGRRALRRADAPAQKTTHRAGQPARRGKGAS